MNVLISSSGRHQLKPVMGLPVLDLVAAAVPQRWTDPTAESSNEDTEGLNPLEILVQRQSPRPV
jgi:hypothetical protein